jgi:hypothetical protein
LAWRQVEQAKDTAQFGGIAANPDQE